MLTDDEILAAIDAAEAVSLSPQSSEIASDRADALDRYNGKPYGDEKPGRSSVVSRDVADIVDGVTANVLKPFVGGDRVVTFNPRGPEDEEAADQETDYVNFVVMERNNGFVVLNSAVKDALLLRNGYVKVGWCKHDDVTIESYYGLSDEELALLAQDEDVKIVAHSEQPAYQVPQVMGQPPQQVPMLHDVKVHRLKPTEYCEILPAPPDEILVSQRATEPSLQKADFVQHRTRKTLSELRELGYKVADDISDSEDNNESVEDFAREVFTNGDQWSDVTQNAARRLVMFKESWIRLDVDGDGIAELRRICQVGKNLLANEDADLIPIACGVPVLMPHRHLGVSVYDLVKDVAEIKTAMLRSHLDNRYLINNAEKVINVDAIENVDDFLISRPGGLKRVRGSVMDAVAPLVVPDTGAGALQTLEYLDSITENRTGYTKSAQGMKSNSLETDTLGEFQQQLTQSGIRLEMIARTIAETLMRDLYRLVHAMTLKYSSRSEKVQLRNKWVAVNPREWVRRTDLSISVGLGSLSGPQQTQSLMMIAQAQQQAMPLGLVTPRNAYNTACKLVTAAGFRVPDDFFTEPQKQPQTGPNGQPQMGPDGKPVMVDVPPPQHPDPLVQAAQIKAQADQQIAMVKHQADGQVAQAKAQADAMAQQARTQADIQIQQHKIQSDAQLEVLKMKMQLELDAQKHAMEQNNAIVIARINAEAKVAAANVTATKQADAAAQAALDKDVA